jgi:hypothetical protein
LVCGLYFFQRVVMNKYLCPSLFSSGLRRHSLVAGVRQFIRVLSIAAALAAASAGDSAAVNTGCVAGACIDVPADGISYTSGVSTVNVGDGVAGTTVVNPGTIGIELSRAGVNGAVAADAEFQTILWDTDDDSNTPDVSVVSRDGTAPYLVDNNYIFDNDGDPQTFTIGTDIYTGIELVEFLGANSSDTGAAISGSLTVNNNMDGAGAPFSTTNAGGIVVRSTGGKGGNGGCFTILFWSWCDDGYRGGDAGSVAVNSNSSIIVNGDSEGKHGVTAISQGGDGGNGGGWFGLFGSNAGGGGDGGNGADVFVTLGPDSSITTHGAKSHGVFAKSVGGNGGSGGDPSGAIALGSDGGNGGDAGNVLVDNDGSILTTGWNAHGIYAESVGAGAGSGSSSGGIYAEGGNGGGESDGAMVTVNNSGTIITENSDSFGILAQSIGGGGGDGGGAGGWFTVGGRGGSGGGSDIVSVFDSGTVQTSGDRSSAIFAQSIGGGGGNGGDAVSVASTISVAVGGDGGLGGNGDEVYVIAQGSDIDTIGDGAHGIHAQSIGGGGGNGGMAVSGTLPGNSPINVSVTLGGNGGGGGDAGELVSVQTTSGTTIDTTGAGSYGIIAQSIGGGGGNGGTALSGSGGGGLSVAVSIGGKGAVAGDGKDVLIDNAGSITTSGDLSAGIFTQSIGGGGGNGGFAGSLAVGGGAASVSIGGSGGSGGAAGQIDVDNSGTIKTGGDSAAGIFAQSIGGGGGNGGSALSGSFGLASVSTTIGGAGGAGNNGGLVDTLNSGRIETAGNNSAGIFAQSIGGGGGSGGDATSLAIAGPVAVTVAVGGAGGSGGTGGEVIVGNEGLIRTEGPNSDAIFAQSIGGSGGSGGSATTGTLVFPIEIEGVEIPAISANVSVGGRGAGGGAAGTVTVTNTGEIMTTDFLSNGVFAQSVGGSGGRGGHATNISIAFDAMFTGKVAVGGSGGQGGIGNTVTVANSGLIQTQGDFSNGVFAQSVGGGGGAGGNATNVSLSLTPPPMAPEDFIPTPSADFDLAIGGNGGDGATGGDVEVKNDGTIVTEGNFAVGVMAQSVGGGGGTGGDARTIQVELTADPMDFLPLTALTSLDVTLVFGGTGGSGSHGGDVLVTNEGDVVTTGAFSHGIVAQSVGGGGGSGGSAMTFEFSNADIVPEIPVLDDISGLTTIEMTLQGSGGAGGDGGDVTVNSIGNIWTSGDFAMGIVAQSVAGGGGLAGFYNPQGITNNELANSLINTFVDTDAGLSFAGSVGGEGRAGDVIVQYTGNIQTLGDGAHGILAQSAAGQGAGGKVSVTIDGNIWANGEDADGILAQSVGLGGADNITIDVNGVVQGGTGSGAGVRFLDGADNSLINHGAISALSTMAITGGKGNDTIDNYGTVTGNVDLGTGSNAFNNREGGLFNAGSSIVLGTGNILNNAGIFSPGGAGAVLTTTLSSSYLQTSEGAFAADIDFMNNVSDRLNLGGLADLAGEVRVGLFNAEWAQPGPHQATILSAGAGVTDSGLTLSAPQSIVMKYELLFPNATDVVIGYDVDFSPEGLNGNQVTIGDYVNAIQTAGGSEGFAPIAAQLVSFTGIGQLASAYDHLSPEPYLSIEPGVVYSNQQFSDSMMSCRVREGEYRFVREGQCGWLRANVTEMDRERTSSNMGYDRYALSLAGGLQGEISNNWHGGFGFSYEHNEIDTGSLAETVGDLVQVGAVLKGRTGGTTYGLAVNGGYGWFETRRSVDLPAPGVKAKSDQEIGFVSGYLRLAHASEWRTWYLRPMINAGATYMHRGRFSEDGAGAANLTVRSEDETYLSVQPTVEIGGEFSPNGGTLLRPYARVGLTHFLSGTSPEITASFEGAPPGVAPFTVKGDMDRNYLEASIGADLLGVNGTTLRLAYVGISSEHTTLNSFMLKLSLPF